jgi:tRNA U38,U39,U40 pseudouridine synthase TruA
VRVLRLAAQINWTRAARTDKGVSAVGQVVSLKARRCARRRGRSRRTATAQDAAPARLARSRARRCRS